MGQYSFFDHENRLHSISKLGAPLERLVAAIPWEIYASSTGAGPRTGTQIQRGSQAVR